MGYWEGKLAGFLHDPLDKVLRKDHAEDAGKIASDLLKGANVSEDVISEVRCHHEEGRLLRVPDMAASAANRIFGSSMPSLFFAKYFWQKLSS